MKYEIIFNGIKRKCKNKVELINTAFFLHNNDVEYSAKEYSNINGVYGWNNISTSDYCRRCGRKLSDPNSVKNGIGPECIKRISMYNNQDNKLSILDSGTSKDIIDSIPNNRKYNCQFCNGELNHTIFYYEHKEGWFVKILGKKVWLWIECMNCGHQWSLEHLRVSRSISF